MDTIPSFMLYKSIIKQCDLSNQQQRKKRFLCILIIVNAYALHKSRTLTYVASSTESDINKQFVEDITDLISENYEEPLNSIDIQTPNSIIAATIWLFQHPYLGTLLHIFAYIISTEIVNYRNTEQTSSVYRTKLCFKVLLADHYSEDELSRFQTLLETTPRNLAYLSCMTILNAFKLSDRQCTCVNHHLLRNHDYDSDSEFGPQPPLPRRIYTMYSTMYLESTAFLLEISRENSSSRQFVNPYDMPTLHFKRFSNLTLESCDIFNKMYLKRSITQTIASDLFLRFEISNIEHCVQIQPSIVLFSDINLENLNIITRCILDKTELDYPKEFFSHILHECKNLIDALPLHHTNRVMGENLDSIVDHCLRERSNPRSSLRNGSSALDHIIMNECPILHLLYPSYSTGSHFLQLLSLSVPALYDITTVSVRRSLHMILTFSRLYICHLNINNFDDLLDAFPLRSIFNFSCRGLASSLFATYLSGIPNDLGNQTFEQMILMKMQYMQWYEILTLYHMQITDVFEPTPHVRISKPTSERFGNLISRMRDLETIRKLCEEIFLKDLHYGQLLNVRRFQTGQPPAPETPSDEASFTWNSNE